MTTAARRDSYQYHYTEPHPTVPRSQRLTVGRGGAGNSTRLAAQDASSAPATGRVTAPAAGPATREPRHFSAGRGGAGNFKDKAGREKQPAHAPSDELDREARINAAECVTGDGRIWHHGRGGGGNVVDRRAASSSSPSRNSAVLSSASSAVSSASGSAASSRNSSFSANSDGGNANAAMKDRRGSLADRIAAKLGAR